MRKVTIEEERKKVYWKAVRGFWDESTKPDFKSGCGIVMTIGKIAVLLKTCTALSAEITEVSILADVLDVIFNSV